MSAREPLGDAATDGAGNTISGLAFDGAGLIAVRPGGASPGTAFGVAYFSPNGLTWQFAGTIGGNRVVALGQEIKAGRSAPFAEQSADGGASWQQVPFRPPGPNTVITALTADSAGFTAAGQYGQPDQQVTLAWTSATVLRRHRYWLHRHHAGPVIPPADAAARLTAAA